MIIEASTPIAFSTGLNGGVQSGPFAIACTVSARCQCVLSVL